MRDANLTLDGGRFGITVEPDRGGKIASIVDSRLGRNLLLDEAQSSPLPLEDGREFLLYGWDEAVPSIEPCGDSPALGHAWRERAVSHLTAGSLGTLWRMPGWQLDRWLDVERDTIRARYILKNTAARPARVLWSGHALYPMDGLRQVLLPLGKPILGPWCTSEDLAALLIDGDSYRCISATAETGRSWKFFLPASRGVDLIYSDTTLTIKTDAPWWGILVQPWPPRRFLHRRRADQCAHGPPQ